MTAEATSPVQALVRQIGAYRLSQAIGVAATLGIADLLAAGPRSADDLAAATETHPRSLYRLLRALAAHGIFEEQDGRRFALNAAANLLRSDADGGLREVASFFVRPYFWQAWGELLHCVKTGRTGAEKVLGTDVWSWRAAHPEETRIFDAAMTAMTRGVAEAVAGAVDWSRYDRVADIAGGHGALLAAILKRHARVRGLLFDQPHVVAGAPPVLEGAGVVDRCEVVAGSFFERVPEANAYVLKSILHDWDDPECVRILQTIRRAALQGARLHVVEQRVGPPNTGAAVKASDLNMLVVPGGVERTREEFETLLAAGGWRLEADHAAGTHRVLVAAPA
jgi:hypothetical protein